MPTERYPVGPEMRAHLDRWRDEQRMSTTVRCRWCGAAPGQRCVGRPGGPGRSSHVQRVVAWREMLEGLRA